MLNDSELISARSGGFKYYSFNSFYPIEKDGVYEVGRVYILKFAV